MAAYALAQISIHDSERYERYAAGFAAALAPFRGRVLAADDSPDIVEGTWNHEKVVLIEFDDRAELDRWATSAEYRAIAKDRIAATTGCVLVLDGFGHRRS